MKLWRVDADFENADGEVVGMLTYFALSRVFDQRSDVLIGWSRDWYEIDVPHLTRDEAARLVGRPWPTLPLTELVALASFRKESSALADVDPDERIELAADDSPVMQDAKRQLHAAIERRQAWEKE